MLLQEFQSEDCIGKSGDKESRDEGGLIIWDLVDVVGVKVGDCIDESGDRKKI